MVLLKNERVLFIAVILILMGVIGVTGFKIYENNEFMLVPRSKLENVKTCIDNYVACSLIYESTEEIPEVAP